MKRMKLAAAVLGLVLVPAVANAQASANITATADVAAAITATWQADLAFGQVYPGWAATVAVADAGAGRVLFNGGVGAEVNVTFTALPANLTGPGANIAIAYTAAHALTLAGAKTNFAPATGTTTVLDSGTGDLYVFLGGAITPAVGQVAGTYSATVTVQAAYTGN